MKNRTKVLIGVGVVILIIVAGVVLFYLNKKEHFSSGPVSFQISQNTNPAQGIVYNYINLPIGTNSYTVMIDTGSPNLVINGFDVANSTPVTSSPYDSYTIYGGNSGTAQDCIKASQTGGQLANECVVQKYYNTNQLSITNQPVTVFAGIYGSTPSIMGLAMPGLLSQGSSAFKLPSSISGQVIQENPLVNWNTGSVQNFTIDFSNNLFTFNDNDEDFDFYPRVRFYGYHTDFYAISCQTTELGVVNIVFDTGLYDCIVPANINSQIQEAGGKLTINSPFTGLIDSTANTYQTMPANLNFLIMGYAHMQSLGKVYFGANHIGIRLDSVVSPGFVPI
jgi:hypothetical protein